MALLMLIFLVIISMAIWVISYEKIGLSVPKISSIQVPRLRDKDVLKVQSPGVPQSSLVPGVVVIICNLSPRQ